MQTQSWQSVYYYFRKWQADGRLEELNSQLNQAQRQTHVKIVSKKYKKWCFHKSADFVLSTVASRRSETGNNWRSALADGAAGFEHINGLLHQSSVNFVYFHSFTNFFEEHNGKSTAEVFPEFVQALNHHPITGRIPGR